MDGLFYIWIGLGFLIGVGCGYALYKVISTKRLNDARGLAERIRGRGP